jgi:hypothetical protein
LLSALRHCEPTGRREARPDDRLREAIQLFAPVKAVKDGITSLAMSKAQKGKTPPASEETDGVFHALTSRKVAALVETTSKRRVRSGDVEFFDVEFLPLGCSADGTASPSGLLGVLILF